MNKRLKKRIKNIFYFMIVTVATFIFIVPFLFVIYTSLRRSEDIIKEGFVAPISTFFPQNYLDAWLNGGLLDGTIYSLSITIPALIIALILSATAAFAIARLNFRGSKAIFFFILLTMYIPAAVKLIPVYQMYSGIGFTNSIFGLVLLQGAGSIPFCAFVLRNFFLTIPKELQEAAIIDGCSYPAIFFRIYMPLSKPSIAVLVILQFTAIWNSFLWELLLMTDNVPIMVAVMSLQSQYGIQWALQCAGAIIASIPTLLIFLAFQKHFISGLTSGAVKG